MNLDKPDLDEILEILDLGRVQSVMKALDLRWLGDREIPSQIKIYKEVQKIYDECYNRFLEQYKTRKQDTYEGVCTGGFTVEMRVAKDSIVADVYFGLSASNRY